LALLSSLAKGEAQKISERTKAGMARAKAVNGTLNLTRVYGDRQFESDPPGVVAVLPASGKNGGQTFSSSLVFAFAACGLAMMPARRLSFSR